MSVFRSRCPAPLCAFLFGLAAATAPLASRPGDIATERTQAATMALITQIQTIDAQIRAVSDTISAFEADAAAVLGGLEELPGVEGVFAVLAQVEDVVRAGQGLAHTVDDVEAFFEGRFDTYEGYLQAIEEKGYIERADVRARLETWNDTHLDTIRNTLTAHGLHADGIETAAGRLALLRERSRTARGRMQVLQIAQEIAAEEVAQLNELQSIVMEQSNLHASYFAVRQSMQADREAQTEWLLRELRPTVIGNEPGVKLR